MNESRLEMYETIRKALMDNWGGIHTNESGGYQGMLASRVVDELEDWLAEHDARVRAEAWAEGLLFGAVAFAEDEEVAIILLDTTDNPYRKETK